MKLPATVLLTWIALAVGAHAEERIVTPKAPNGWTFGIQGSSKTVKWILGYNNAAPNLGTGDWWSFTGEADGCPYAETDAFRSVPLASVTRLGYDSFTPFVARRTDIQIAPEMRLYLDVPGYQPGEVYLQFSPGNQGTVPTGRWTSWNPLLGKWWSNKQGGSTLFPLTEWVNTYRNATINRLRMMTGTISNGNSELYRIFNNWSFGADNIAFSYGLNEVVIYNFEADAEPDKTEIKPTATTISEPPKVESKPSSTTINLTVLAPTFIESPTYYIFNGTPQGSLPAPKQTEKSSYSTLDGFYVPIMFDGNTTIRAALKNQIYSEDAFPTFADGGAYLFGGVPFLVPSRGNNAWAGSPPSDGEEHRLTVQANLDGVLEVHTLINTYGGGGTEQGMLAVEFRGAKGAFYRKELVMGRDVRDYVSSKFDTIQSPNSKAWTYVRKRDKAELRSDRQLIRLPDEFLTQALKTVTLVDNGRNRQQALLFGVTAKVQLKPLSSSQGKEGGAPPSEPRGESDNGFGKLQTFLKASSFSTVNSSRVEQTWSYQLERTTDGVRLTKWRTRRNTKVSNARIIPSEDIFVFAFADVKVEEKPGTPGKNNEVMISDKNQKSPLLIQQRIAYDGKVVLSPSKREWISIAGFTVEFETPARAKEFISLLKSVLAGS